MAKKWNYDTCFELAKKCNSKGELKAANYQAYHVARINGWLDDYTWFKAKYKPSGYWTRENCYNEAKKYKSSVDFRKNAAVAYMFATRNNWIADYTWLGKGVLSKKRIYVVYCYKDEDTNAVYVGLTNNLRQRHWQHCNGILKNGERRYDIVYRYFQSIGKDVPQPVIKKGELYAKEAQQYEKQYLKQYKDDGFVVLNLAKAGSLGAYGKWSKEMCYNEAKKYQTREEFKFGNNSAYNAARRNGWIDEYTWFLSPFRWTKELCYEEAKKARSKSEFKRNSSAAYSNARTNGWLGDYTWFIELRKSNGYWNRKTCYEEAKKYKSRKEYEDKAGSAYNISLKKGWLNDYTWFKEKARRNYWNRETCYAEAKKCISITTFIRNSRRAYEVARKNEWLDDYTWFKELKKRT